MLKALDFYDDANQQQLYALEKLYGTPEFVKKAAIETPEELGSLPDSVFADPRNRKFPCHTKAATWLAQAYFSMSAPAYSKQDATFVQDRINKSASYWGIKGIVDGFKNAWEKIAHSNNMGLRDDDYALVVEHEGNKIRRMPMPNALSVKVAGEYLFANRYQYPYAWRKQAARRILAKAVEYDEKAAKGEKIAGAEVGATRFEPETLNYLERASGFGIVPPIRAAEKIAQRVLMLNEKHQDVRVKLAEMAVELKTSPILDCETLQKLAEAIDNVDRTTGLAMHYHEGVELPEEMFFDVLEKEAAAIVDGHVTLTTGTIYPIEAFAELPLGKIAEVMGKDFIDEVSDGNQIDPIKFASIAKTLPRPDATLLESAIEAAAVEALHKSASHRPNTPDSLSASNLGAYLTNQGNNVVTHEKTLTKLSHPQAVTDQQLATATKEKSASPTPGASAEAITAPGSAHHTNVPHAIGKNNWPASAGVHTTSQEND